jgi:hypothetical protein
MRQVEQSLPRIHEDLRRRLGICEQTLPKIVATVRPSPLI